MQDVLITGLPDIDEHGTKRWYVGDIKHGTEKVFVFENPRDKVTDRNARFVVCVLDAHDACQSENFFARRYTMHRFASRLFNARGIQFTELETADEAVSA